MTVMEPSSPVCPACHSHQTMIGVQGNGLCFDCRHEWDPSEVVAFPHTERPVVVDARPDEAFYPDAVPTPDLTEIDPHEELAELMAEDEATSDVEVDPLLALIGTQCRLEGGQAATFVSFPDDDHAEVELPDGRIELISVNDIDRSVEPTTVVVSVPVTLDDEAAAELCGAILMLSGLIVTSGIAVRGETPADDVAFDVSTAGIVGGAATELVVRIAVPVVLAALDQVFVMPVDRLMADIAALDDNES